eukprot:1144854-Pelagomonas_calceolata.AAC.2
MRSCCDEVHPCKAHVSAAPSPLYRKATGNITESNLGLTGWLDRASEGSSGISAKLAFKRWYSYDLGRS